MKLRMKTGALRLRVLRSELARLGQGETIEEEVRFPAGGAVAFALSVAAQADAVSAAIAGGRITVRVSEERFAEWSKDSQVGIYESLTVAGGEPLEVVVEKDFACLDGNEAENADTFENPLAGKVC